MKMKIFIQISIFLFFTYQGYTQEIYSRDTLGNFEIQVIRKGINATVVIIHESRADTLYHGTFIDFPMHNVSQIKLFDEKRLVIIYKSGDMLFYILKTWDGREWDIGFVNYIIDTYSFMPADIEIVKYNELVVRQNNAALRISLDVENGIVKREMINH